jgi:protein-tyrosine sulfotransferase
VVKPINLEALTKWVGHMPASVKQELDVLAPMLKTLGYDTQSDVPTYGIADQVVLDNMMELKKNAALWDAKAKAYARQLPNQSKVIENQLTNLNEH